MRVCQNLTSETVNQERTSLLSSTFYVCLNFLASTGLNPNKSLGPADGLHPRVLKELANKLKYSLHKLFSRLLKEGKVPPEWKIAEVRPIFKKGEKSIQEIIVR